MSLLDKQLLVVIGKGGVGKTTASAAFALAAAARGKRVLVAMCNCRERLSELQQTAPIGAKNQSILPNIDAVNIEPLASMQEYASLILKVPALVQAVFANRLVAAFLQGAPGLSAWSMLGKAYYHATADFLPNGQRRYDLVVLDAPATGHGLEMLHVPGVIADIAPPGPLRKDAELALQLMRDPARTAAVVVTLPEDLPVSETFELYAMLRHPLQLPVTHLVINRILPVLFDAAKSAALKAAALRHDSPVLAVARRRQHQEASQARCLERLSSLPLGSIRFPYRADGLHDRKALAALADACSV